VGKAYLRRREEVCNGAIRENVAYYLAKLPGRKTCTGY
jgi:hypothetical protein